MPEISGLFYFLISSCIIIRRRNQSNCVLPPPISEIHILTESFFEVLDRPSGRLKKGKIHHRSIHHFSKTRLHSLSFSLPLSLSISLFFTISHPNHQPFHRIHPPHFFSIYKFSRFFIFLLILFMLYHDTLYLIIIPFFGPLPSAFFLVFFQLCTGIHTRFIIIIIFPLIFFLYIIIFLTYFFRFLLLSLNRPICN